MVCKKQQINEFCVQLLSSDDYKKRVYETLIDDPDHIENNYAGHLSESVFSELILKGNRDNIICETLPLIVDCVSDDSITEDVFELLISFKKKSTRTRLIVSLSHKKLNALMLKKLCLTNTCFECFFELIILMYTDSNYTPDDLHNSIELFLKSPFSDLKKPLFEELQSVKSDDKRKTNVIECLR